MTDKDKQLIEKANHLDCTDWHKCKYLVAEAESEEAKQLINDQGTRLYHKEESFADLL